MTGPREWMTRGVERMPSMTSRFGKLTLDAGIDVFPFWSLTAPCGPACVTAAVCAETADEAPLGLVAVTETRIVPPTSVDWTEYVCDVEPATAAQPLPFASHRSHWYVKVGVL